MSERPKHVPEFCPECKHRWPGHAIDCVTDNKKAKAYQDAIDLLYRNRNKRRRVKL